MRRLEVHIKKTSKITEYLTHFANAGHMHVMVNKHVYVDQVDKLEAVNTCAIRIPL